MAMMTNAQTIVRIEKQALEALCKEVKETLATEVALRPSKPSFGVADLWKIHRTQRYRVQRRNLM